MDKKEKKHFVFRDHDTREVVFECDAVNLRAAKHQRYYWLQKVRGHGGKM